MYLCPPLLRAIPTPQGRDGERKSQTKPLSSLRFAIDFEGFFFSLFWTATLLFQFSSLILDCNFWRIEREGDLGIGKLI